METFTRIMTTSNSLRMGQHKVAAITSNKQKATPKKPVLKKCVKCGKVGHLDKECRSSLTCTYCHWQRHSAESCWINPA